MKTQLSERAKVNLKAGGIVVVIMAVLLVALRLIVGGAAGRFTLSDREIYVESMGLFGPPEMEIYFGYDMLYIHYTVDEREYFQQVDLLTDEVATLTRQQMSDSIPPLSGGENHSETLPDGTQIAGVRSPTGKYVIVDDGAYTISQMATGTTIYATSARLYATDTGELHEFEFNGIPASSLVFSPDGTQFALYLTKSGRNSGVGKLYVYTITDSEKD